MRTALAGTKYDILQENKILVIEDIGEAVYKIERMLYNLELSGVLSQIKGLIVGQFTEMSEPDKNGDTMYDMINRMVKRYDYPVAFDYPIGHVDYNLPIIEGSMIEFNVCPQEVKLTFL